MSKDALTHSFTLSLLGSNQQCSHYFYRVIEIFFANGKKSLIRDKREIGFEGRVLIVKAKCRKKFFA